MNGQFCQNPCDVCPINDIGDAISRKLCIRALNTYMGSSHGPGHISYEAFVGKAGELFDPFVLSDEEDGAATLAFLLISGGNCKNYQYAK